MNGYTAKPLINNNLSTFKNEDYIDSKYYKNPELYCSINKNKYPCPNFWIKTEEIENQRETVKNNKSPKIVKTYCKKNNQHELELCDVNDNQRTLLIRTGLEDQGKC